ncbi:MAG: hypothetical protein QF357_01525 [Dehalococcoidia bacterium]|jgi:hypothetical protein|nr:hypothetical protein [Dehalococcoidia bacterium]|tara:strand:- start:50 stop:592 length:543 start_codon:yes stop_codon:yes gene_type:complete
MTLEQVVIGLIRIAGSLPVLRWALAGALIAIVVDFSDLFWMGVLDFGGLGNYQAFDKWIDLVYMLTFLWVANRWNGPERTVTLGLFAFRMIGFIAFEFTGARPVLLVFPNVFEFWFVFVAIRLHYWPNYVMTRQRLVIWLAVCLVLKLGQEWVLHGGQYLDDFTLFEAIETTWDFVIFWT